MSKAILILNEMPESCIKCKLGLMYGSFCAINGDTYVTEGNKSEDCPLKPILNKRTNYVMYENVTFVSAEEQIAYLCGYEDGWNDCINELVGEEE